MAPTVRNIVIGAALALAWSLGLGAAGAVEQSFQQIAPKSLPAMQVPPPPADGPMPDLGGDETELAAHLKGLVIVSHPEDLKGENLPTAADHGIRFVSGIAEDDQKALRPILEAYLDKPVSMASVNEILRDIILYYRGKGRPITDAYLPEQTMVDDTVEIVVAESKLGKVTVEGNKWFPSPLIKAKIRAEEGGPISARQINSDVAWINRNPFLQSQLVYEAGEEPGTTDIVLKTQDRFPVRFYTGYEDSGNTLTGQGRFLGGFNMGNAFGIGDQFNYQYTTSTDLNLLRAHSASYIHQLPWHHLITVFGSYADTKADFAGLPLQSTGDAWQTSIRYTVPLEPLTMPWGTYSQELSAGYDFKESTSQLLFNGPANNSLTDVSQFTISYNSSLNDPYGSTSFNASGFYSPGGMMTANSDAAFVSANSSGSTYAYGHFTLNRVVKLPYDTSFIAKAAYQIADARLLSSEQIGLGGYDSVRGYDEREANGDNGYFLSGELRAPPFSLGHLVADSYTADQLQFLTFMDYGGVSQYKPDDMNLGGTPSNNPNINLWSTGLGFRYSIAPYITVRFDYGFQLIDSDVNYLFREHDGSRGHLGIVISY